MFVFFLILYLLFSVACVILIFGIAASAINEVRKQNPDFQGKKTKHPLIQVLPYLSIFFIPLLNVLLLLYLAGCRDEIVDSVIEKILD